MSTIDFNSLVTRLILEAESPVWYKQVIRRFKESTESTTLSDTIPPTGDLFKTLQIALKGDTGNVSPRQISISLLALFDLFVSLVETNWTVNEYKRIKPTNLEDFITKLQGAYNTDDQITKIIDNWLSLDTYLWQEYTPTTRNGSEVQRKAQGEADTLGAVALQTLNNQNILGATQIIVAKRINALEAITSLRFNNFQNVIKDIFNRLPGYVSGSIKITKDFDKLVDDLYVADIYSVAALTMAFYDSEISRISGAENQTIETPETAQMKLPGFESYKISNKFYETNLLKEEGTAATVAAALAAVGLTGAIINYIKKRPYDPGFINFIEKGIIDTTTKDGQDVKSKTQYTVGNIQKIQTKEARALIQKLQSIAQYTKKRIGAGEVIGKAAGALGALRVGMGPVG